MEIKKVSPRHGGAGSPFEGGVRGGPAAAGPGWLIHLDGRKFRRQYSIDNYIVDFCCPSEKLIIELDGAPHGEYQPPRPGSVFAMH